MKKPSLRVSKWMGEIPVEAACTACPNVTFRANSGSHRPSRQEYQESLQRQFDAHYKSIHAEQGSN
jgi:hypothetical protein